jgi:hypothetical protein
LFNQTQTHKQGEEKEVKNAKEKEEKGQEAATNEIRERLELGRNSHSYYQIRASMILRKRIVLI